MLQPDALAVPYCQSAPNNTELEGFYQCQWQGSNQESFVGGLTLGEAGTIPFGLTAAVSPLGSCPAQTSGPVADGDQLTSTNTNPGTAAIGDSTGNNTSSDTSASASVVASTSAVSTLAAASTAAAATTSAVTVDSITATATATAASSSSSSSSSFLLANGEDAQQQNAEFATLTANSSCTGKRTVAFRYPSASVLTHIFSVEGEDACVNGEFAQCISGAYVLQSCGSGLSCYALPLVNSVGTSITCTTESDAETRIAATGATGGVTGSNSSSASSSVAVASSSATSSAAATSATASAVSAASSSNFLLANGQQAQQQNAEFASLTESSSCTGELPSTLLVHADVLIGYRVQTATKRA